MTDLDRAIREDLDDDVLIPCSGGDHVDHTQYQAVTSALRAVLDLCKAMENMPQYGGADYEIQVAIAEALGVSND